MSGVTVMIWVGLVALCAVRLRGDAFHNFLVQDAVQSFRGAGFEVTTERALRLESGETDYVDVLAERADLTVCCEVETSARYTLVNARKAAALGLPLVVVVPSRKLRSSVIRKLGRRSERPGRHGIRVLLLSELRQRLANCFPFFPPANAQGKNKKQIEKPVGKPSPLASLDPARETFSF